MVINSNCMPEPEPLTPAERARLEQVEGVIFDIQRYSLHDGPGLRTNVFFKGCPLRCGWCSNPESQALAPELGLFASSCIACGQFAEACPVGWGAAVAAGSVEALREKYDPRTVVCPTGAARWIGRLATAGEIMQEVRRDAPFYEDGGGMTLAGGEATMQPLLAEALLRLAREDGIATAMETCGHTHWTVLERLLPYLDLVLFDLKHPDSLVHRTFTGMGNDLILANLRRLAAWQAPLVIRVPLIPGFNASPATLEATARLVQELDGAVRSVDLLPYHTLGQAKYKALGRAYPWAGRERLSEAEVERLAGIVAAYGLAVTVGG